MWDSFSARASPLRSDATTLPPGLNRMVQGMTEFDIAVLPRTPSFRVGEMIHGICTPLMAFSHASRLLSKERDTMSEAPIVEALAGSFLRLASLDGRGRTTMPRSQPHSVCDRYIQTGGALCRSRRQGHVNERSARSAQGSASLCVSVSSAGADA